MNCSLPGSSVLGICQPRILEWTAISFSRGSSQPRNRMQVSCIAGRLFTTWATRVVLRVFSSESALHVRWSNYCSFSISPSSEYSGSISFRNDWFDLASNGLSRVFSSTAIQKHLFFSAHPSLWSNSHIPYMTIGKTNFFFPFHFQCKHSIVILNQFPHPRIEYLPCRRFVVFSHV